MRAGRSPTERISAFDSLRSRLRPQGAGEVGRIAALSPSREVLACHRRTDTESFSTRRPGASQFPRASPQRPESCGTPSELEFSDADVNAELDAMRITDPEEREELFSQYSENYRNAWLVVLEFDGEPGALDFGRFSYGATPDSPYNQAAWEETILVSDAGRTEGRLLPALSSAQSTHFGTRRHVCPCPKPAPAPPGLFEKAPYSSPD